MWPQKRFYYSLIRIRHFSNLYNQQVFDLVVDVYHRGINLGRGPELVDLPAGLTLEPLENLGSGRERIGNQDYEVRRVRSKVRAVTAGHFTLAPTARIEVRTPRQQPQRRGFFDQFFGGMQSQVATLQPDPIELKIKSLPTTGRPDHFSGAVGQFTFTIDAKPTELNVGDPITISMTIKGAGNIENVTTPEIVQAEDFKVYEARLVSQDAAGKTFEQVVLPRSDAVTSLPPVSFSYFDPIAEEYRSITRGPVDLIVHAASNHAVQLVGGSTTFAQQKARVLGSDIVYLKPLPQHWVNLQAKPWYAGSRFLALQILPLVGLALLAGFVRRRDVLDKDVARARRQKAPKSARAGLKKADEALREGNDAGFFEGLWEGLSAYFGNRLNLAPGAVVPDDVLAALRQAHLPESDCETLGRVFSQCEQARFGAVTGPEDSGSEASLEELKRILKACERIRIS